MTNWVFIFYHSRLLSSTKMALEPEESFKAPVLISSSCLLKARKKRSATDQRQARLRPLREDGQDRRATTSRDNRSRRMMTTENQASRDARSCRTHVHIINIGKASTPANRDCWCCLLNHRNNTPTHCHHILIKSMIKML